MIRDGFKHDTFGGTACVIRERIKPDALYIVALPQGISGFPKPSIPAIVTGRRLKRDHYFPWSGSRVIVSAATYRMDDGRMPEFQAQGDIQAVTTFLAANPWSYAAFL